MMLKTLMDAHRRHHIVIFVVALATIVFQVLATRILSVTFYYHFAFAGITFAMLGLTIGALHVYLRPLPATEAEINEQVARYGLRFSLAAPLAMLFALYHPLIQWTHGATAVLAALLLIGAFACSSVCITLLLTRFSRQVSTLYACDLIGASLGCVAVILLLRFFDPVSNILLIGAATALTMGWILPPHGNRILQKGVHLGAALLLIAALIMAVSYRTDNGLLPLQWAKGKEQAKPLFERWNTYSRVAVTEFNQPIPPHGWGFGRDHSDRLIEQRLLTIDADAGTVLTRFDGDLTKVDYLKNDIINLGYHVRPVGDAMVIGAGGGRDILSALTFDARTITAVELNPAIIEALTQAFGEFAGSLDHYPGVKLVNAEARSYLRQQEAKHDLIQISLIDTWAATAAGGLTLSENRLYTTDAWREFLSRLSGKGMLSVSRWFDSEMHQGEYYRLLAIAARVLSERFPTDDVHRHILAAQAGSIVTVLISPKAFGSEEVARFHAACAAQGFVPMLPGGEASDPTVALIASGRADKAFYDGFAMDISPPTDDRPFFFQMYRFGDVFGFGGWGENINSINNTAMITLACILGLSLAVAALCILRPLAILSRSGQRPPLPHLLYFGLIGLGFMLIEVAQMQRLIIFLGHPVHGLSVVLFTLLFFGGLGSYTVSEDIDENALRRKPLLLCAMLAFVDVCTPAATEWVGAYGTAARIACSIALLAPMGFCMGMMFPLGMLLSRSENEQFLPWLWGVNGVASVVASVGGFVLSMQLGITATYWIGVLCYAACVAVLWRLPVSIAPVQFSPALTSEEAPAGS